MTSTDGDATAFAPGSALEFLQRLWRVNHALECVSARTVRALNLTSQQRFLVRCIGKWPGSSPRELAARLRVDPSTVSIALARLEARGLLVRRRSPSDRRHVTVALTAAGRALDLPTPHTVEAAVEALLATLPARDLRVGAELLDALAMRLERAAAAPLRPTRRQPSPKPAGVAGRRRVRAGGATIAT